MVYEKQQDYASPERLAATDVGVFKWRKIVSAFANGEKGRPTQWKSAAQVAAEAEGHGGLREAAEAQ